MKATKNKADSVETKQLKLKLEAELGRLWIEKTRLTNMLNNCKEAQMLNDASLRCGEIVKQLDTMK